MSSPKYLRPSKIQGLCPFLWPSPTLLGNYVIIALSSTMNSCAKYEQYLLFRKVISIKNIKKDDFAPGVYVSDKVRTRQCMNIELPSTVNFCTTFEENWFDWSEPKTDCKSCPHTDRQLMKLNKNVQKCVKFWNCEQLKLLWVAALQFDTLQHDLSVTFVSKTKKHSNCQLPDFSIPLFSF